MKRSKIFTELTIASMVSLGIISAFLLFNPFKTHLDADLSPDPAIQKLEQDIDQLVKQYEAYDYNFGIQVTSTTNDEVMYSRNQDSAFVPASNLKLFSTAIALETLGSDYKWKNLFYTHGNIENGVLDGDLIFKAEGDPSISEHYLDNGISSLFKSWAKQIKEAGIHTIKGNLIVDNSAFANHFIGKGWRNTYEQSYYAALPSAFAINENFVRITVKGAGKSKLAPSVSIYPYNGGLKIVNKAITTTKRVTKISISRDNEQNIIYVSGSIGRNRTSSQSINIPQPGQYAGEMLYATLKNQDMNIKGKLIVENINNQTENAQILISNESPELSQLLQRINKTSNNFMANQIYLSLGYLLSNDASKSEQLIKDYMQYNGINTAQLQIDDGSGLSPINNATPRQFSELLHFMSQSKSFDAFYDSFPIAGVDGTLKNVMRFDPLYKNVRGKTGTINNVKSLCGYIFTRDYELLTFTILVNDIKASRYKIYQFNNELLTILGKFSRNTQNYQVHTQNDSLKIN